MHLTGLTVDKPAIEKSSQCNLIHPLIYCPHKCVIFQKQPTGEHRGEFLFFFFLETPLPSYEGCRESSREAVESAASSQYCQVNEVIL